MKNFLWNLTPEGKGKVEQGREHSSGLFLLKNLMLEMTGGGGKAVEQEGSSRDVRRGVGSEQAHGYSHPAGCTAQPGAAVPCSPSAQSS